MIRGKRLLIASVQKKKDIKVSVVADGMFGRTAAPQTIVKGARNEKGDY